MSDTVIVEDEIVTVVSVATQGPPGPGLADTDDLAEGATNKYDKAYTQNFTNESTVTVTHNLGKYPAVTVITSAGDEVEGNVNHINTNSLTVTFSSATGGVVLCN